jgi:plasmid stability protein
MKELRIRKLDEWVVASLRARAKRHGRSLEAELRVLLAEEARRPRREFLERTRALRASIQAECGLLPDSTPLIREDRDARG